MSAFIVYDYPDGGDILGVVAAGSPEQVAASLGGEYQREVPEPLGSQQGHFIVLPEGAFVALAQEDPRYEESPHKGLLQGTLRRQPDAPATLSEYRKGDLVLVRPTAWLQEGEGDRTLQLQEVPLLQVS